MISLVVFDMAGTTVDEDNVVYKTLTKAITEGGYPVDLSLVLEHGAGKEKLQAIRDVLQVAAPAATEETAVRIHTNFRSLLGTAYEQLDVKPGEGAEQVFEKLRALGVKVALNTGYDRKTALLLMDKLGWKEGETVDVVVTATDVTRNRPEPDMVLKVMERLGITDASKAVKVGDSAIDILEGRNAGCLLNIGITGGAQTASQLMEANPDFIITKLEEIITIVKNTSH